MIWGGKGSHIKWKELVFCVDGKKGGQGKETSGRLACFHWGSVAKKNVTLRAVSVWGPWGVLG